MNQAQRIQLRSGIAKESKLRNQKHECPVLSHVLCVSCPLRELRSLQYAAGTFRDLCLEKTKPNLFMCCSAENPNPTLI